MFAKARGLIVFQPGGLHVDHWVWPYVAYPDAKDVEVRVNGETVRTRLDGQWIWPEVSLCESYSIRLGDNVVTIRDEALFWADEDVILVPAGEWQARGVLQCSSFIDTDDHFRNDLQQADSDALRVLIRRLRATDPVEAVQSLVEQLNLEKYPLLHGRTFRLTVGPASGQHAVELVA